MSFSPSCGLRAGFIAIVAAVALLAASPASTGTAGATSVVISGHGWGHGIGLSQWGAEKRAAAGSTYSQILSFYYPGTTLGTAPATRVRVLLAERPRVQVGSKAPFSIADAAGTVVRLTAGLHSIGPDGRIGSRTLALPAVARPGAAPLRLGGTGYLGTLRIDASAQQVRVVNTLELEDYLVGVVSSECPGYWRPGALRAQAVASRSYALANLRPRAPFDLHADDRSQNYHGLLKHFASAEAAVNATRGEVLLHKGAVVNALFSAANGGLTSVPDGIWTNGTPSYFAARPDAFDAKSPNTNWGPFTVSLAAVREAFPQLPATVAKVSVARNAGQRVTSLTFVGADGSTVSIGGYAFQQRLALRSTYFAVGTA